MKIRTIIAATLLLTATPSFGNSGNGPENKYGVVTRCNVLNLPPPLWTHWIPCLSALFRM